MEFTVADDDRKSESAYQKAEGNVKFLTIVVRKCVEIFSMKIKKMDLWMQIEGTKLIFIMSISGLDFFKFAFRMPQIAQILVSNFKFFRGSMPPDPLEIFSFFSMSNSRLWLQVVFDNQGVWPVLQVVFGNQGVWWWRCDLCCRWCLVTRGCDLCCRWCLVTRGCDDGGVTCVAGGVW